MKTNPMIRRAGLAALVILLAGVLWIRIAGRSGGNAPAPAAGSAATPEPTQVPAASGVTPKWVAKETPGVEPRPIAARLVVSADGNVHVNSSQVLATVNGVAITLKDLVPLAPGEIGKDRSLSVDRYDFLLNRAVERELAFQAGNAQQVGLTREQKARLDEALARSGQREPAVFDPPAANFANVEFDARDFTGLLLQASLAAKAGVPSPHVTEDRVAKYYQEHHAEFGALPVEDLPRQAAWDRIDSEIRRKLAPQVAAEYQEQLQRYLDQLKANANIVVLASARR